MTPLARAPPEAAARHSARAPATPPFRNLSPVCPLALPTTTAPSLKTRSVPRGDRSRHSSPRRRQPLSRWLHRASPTPLRRSTAPAIPPAPRAPAGFATPPTSAPLVMTSSAREPPCREVPHSGVTSTISPIRSRSRGYLRPRRTTTARLSRTPKERRTAPSSRLLLPRYRRRRPLFRPA